LTQYSGPTTVLSSDWKYLHADPVPFSPVEQPPPVSRPSRDDAARRLPPLVSDYDYDYDYDYENGSGGTHYILGSILGSQVIENPDDKLNI
jgi:hypothetical protein